MRYLAIACFSLVIAVFSAAPGAHAQAPSAAAMAWPDKNEASVVFTSRVVWDMERALKFYIEGLGMQRVGGYGEAGGSSQEVFLAFADTPRAV
jgi:hypothetical protein